MYTVLCFFLFDVLIMAVIFILTTDYAFIIKL